MIFEIFSTYCLIKTWRLGVCKNSFVMVLSGLREALRSFVKPV